MRRTRTISRAARLIACATLIGGVALVATSAPASAQDGRDDTPTTQAVTSTAPLPSCSLHPTRNADGSLTLTNTNHAPRFLQVFDVDGRMIYSSPDADGLPVGASVTLTGAFSVIWSGHAYPITAYDNVTDPGPWCVAAPTTTTAPPPPPTTAPPTTTSTAPVAPPTTVPVTTTAPPTTEPPTVTTTAPPCAEDDPCWDCTTMGNGTCETTTTEPPVCLAVDASTGVCGVQVERAAVLAVTGGHPSAGTIAGLSLLVTGLACLLAAAWSSRRHAAA
jgi:hypothetical protein